MVQETGGGPLICRRSLSPSVSAEVAEDAEMRFRLYIYKNSSEKSANAGGGGGGDAAAADASQVLKGREREIMK